MFTGLATKIQIKKGIVDHLEKTLELLKAVENGNLSDVKRCIELAGNAIINALEKNDRGRERSPLMLAVELGQLDKVRYLLQNGAEVDKTNDRGSTALMIAAQANRVAELQALLEQGADKDKSN